MLFKTLCNLQHQMSFLKGSSFLKGDFSLIILRDILGLLANNCVIIFPGQFIRNMGIELECWQLWSYADAEKGCEWGELPWGPSGYLVVVRFTGDSMLSWVGRHPGCQWASLPWSPPPCRDVCEFNGPPDWRPPHLQVYSKLLPVRKEKDGQMCDARTR